MNTHLCFFIDTHVMGGAEQYLMDLIDGMLEKGYRVSVICHRFMDLVQTLQNRFSKRGVNIYAHNFPSITRSAAVQQGLAKNRALGGVFNLLKIPGLLFCYINILRSYGPMQKLLKSIKPDIFHISAGGYPASESYRTAVLAARRLGIPRRVMTVHNQAPRPPIALPEHWIDRAIERRLQAITTASWDAKNALVQNRKFQAAGIRVIHYGITPAGASPLARETSRNKLGVSSSAVVIGTLGALQPRKGHAFLMTVFEAIAADFPDLHLMIIGSGPCQAELDTQRKKMPYGHRVHLPGYLPNAKNYLAAFDIFAFPSLAYECLPYAVLEAMQAGLPIIGSSVGGIPEEIEQDRSGVLAPPGDLARWKDALCALLRDKARAQRLAQEAQERVREQFSLRKMIDETETLYAHH